VLSTVNVKNGMNKPTIPELTAVLPSDIAAIDRTTMNSWEDVEFRRAIEATGRTKLVMVALWTEVCLTFPLLDAMRAGYEAYPVVDAVAGTSKAAHRTAISRLVAAGAVPVSWIEFACELQRDWARTETVEPFRNIVFHSTPPSDEAKRDRPVTAAVGSDRVDQGSR
jgi:nicotinamidase-related amidase